MNNTGKVFSSFKTTSVSSFYRFLRKLYRKPGEGEQYALNALSDFTYNWDNNLFSAAYRLREIIDAVKQFPIHRTIKEIEITFDCPIWLDSGEMDAGDLAVQRLNFAEILGAKPSVICLSIHNGEGVYTLTIGSPQHFKEAVKVFIKTLLEMNNMIFLFKKSQVAERLAYDHNWTGSARESRSACQHIADWLKRKTGEDELH